MTQIPRQFFKQFKNSNYVIIPVASITHTYLVKWLIVPIQITKRQGSYKCPSFSIYSSTGLNVVVGKLTVILWNARITSHTQYFLPQLINFLHYQLYSMQVEDL